MSPTAPRMSPFPPFRLPTKSAPIIADTPLPARLGAARADLKAALIAGNDTRTARATLARFEAEAERQSAAEAAAAAEIERTAKLQSMPAPLSWPPPPPIIFPGCWPRWSRHRHQFNPVDKI